MELPLTALRNGETGIITTTDMTKRQSMCKHKARKACKMRFTPARFIKRLTDLGLTPGTKVKMVKSAPFNGPLEVCVRGSRLAIGRGMANRILVDVKR
jgi:Fe2+ transport system protein FeoA